MERLNLDKVKIMAAAATLAMFAGTACAHVEVYADINKAYTQLWADKQDTGAFTDNNYSPSKIGVMSSAHLNKCTTYGGVAELELIPNNTRLVSQLVTENVTNHFVLARKVEAWVSGGMWGKLSLGLGEAASWDITNISYSGTNQTSLGSSVANNAGGMIFGVKNTNPTTTNPTVNSAFNALNGIGDIDTPNGIPNTKDRVRYDTADWAGLKLSVSYGNTAHIYSNLTTQATSTFPYTRRAFFDAAVRYMACMDDFQLGAGFAGMWYNGDGATNEVFVNGATNEFTAAPTTTLRAVRGWAGSVALEHKPSGFNVAVAGGAKRKISSTLSNYKFWYVQLGKKFCVTNYGKTNFAVDYFHGKNAVINDAKSKSWSVGLTQDLHKIHSAVYAAVREYKYTYTGSNLQNLVVMTLGAQFKFGAML